WPRRSGRWRWRRWLRRFGRRRWRFRRRLTDDRQTGCCARRNPRGFRVGRIVMSANRVTPIGWAGEPEPLRVFVLIDVELLAAAVEDVDRCRLARWIRGRRLIDRLHHPATGRRWPGHRHRRRRNLEDR